MAECADLLRGIEYTEENASVLIDRVCEACIKKLVDNRRPMKYIGKSDQNPIASTLLDFC